jgi:predicted DNA repair protein MutK
MFLVGGGIVVHGIHPLEALVHDLTDAAGAAAFLVPTLVNGLAGIVVGAIAVGLVTLGKRVKGAIAG